MTTHGGASRAHPRSRGENMVPLVLPNCICGSSPLTRGKHVRSDVDVVAAGLIPAHAGKTTDRQRLASCPRAHPRSRGENPDAASSKSCTRGSSPLTRGKRRPRELVLRGRGLIPAHAGKTALRRPRAALPRAHPRSRGENLDAALDGGGHGGSSPLTRGKLSELDERAQEVGLIPAHAGKTFIVNSKANHGRAHPRSRGENPSG